MKKQKVIWVLLCLSILLLIMDNITVYRYTNSYWYENFSLRTNKEDIALLKENNYLILEPKRNIGSIYFIGGPNTNKNKIFINDPDVRVEKVGWLEYVFGNIRVSIVDELTTGL